MNESVIMTTLEKLLGFFSIIKEREFLVYKEQNTSAFKGDDWIIDIPDFYGEV